MIQNVQEGAKVFFRTNSHCKKYKVSQLGHAGKTDKTCKAQSITDPVYQNRIGTEKEQ